ncbi:hypothetical protein PR048_016416 [Dryococelus australis]|uniref:Uncharacterized protein n=1 Tax=Dryococelus australis TaxID=614101 RepID=A0ABQ9HK37_9NEOP|nr:hypothetical protein PR048_016416 [Dryococelus australis]
MLTAVQQEKCLGNEKNKTKLIELLVETLTARGLEANTATEDVDLLVLLTALTTPDRNAFFMKPGRGNIEDKVYSTRQLQEQPFSGSNLFIRSFTGCDTCAIFNDNKLSILKCFLKMPNETKAMPGIYYDPNSTLDAVAQAGEEMFLTMYQDPPIERDLNNHRYNSFVKSSTKVKANLASLPMTKGAAKQHYFRVYIHMQQWLDNDSLNPTRWGWVRDNGGVLNPVRTTYLIAPYSVLI